MSIYNLMHYCIFYNLSIINVHLIVIEYRIRRNYAMQQILDYICLLLNSEISTMSWHLFEK
jgi:hypothetical protein